MLKYLCRSQWRGEKQSSGARSSGETRMRRWRGDGAAIINAMRWNFAELQQHEIWFCNAVMIRTSNTPESQAVANSTQRNLNYANVIRLEAFTSSSRALAAFCHLFTQQYFQYGSTLDFCMAGGPASAPASSMDDFIGCIPILTFAHRTRLCQCFVSWMDASHTHTPANTYTRIME